MIPQQPHHDLHMKSKMSQSNQLQFVAYLSTVTDDSSRVIPFQKN